MGYRYEKRIDENGNACGVCIFPDGAEAGAWDFFRGRAGRAFSYCAKKGYEVRAREASENGYVTECAECVIPSEKGMPGQRVEMLELMKTNRDFKELIDRLQPESPSLERRQPTRPLFPSLRSLTDDPNPSPSNKKSGRRGDIAARILSAETLSQGQMEAMPPAFDWRNVNGRAYIGPIRDNGDCGSCYAFSAAAAAEGVYNAALNLFDSDCVDFSESFIIWCLAAFPEYNANFYGCDGADYEYAELDALVRYGIPMESDYPYTIFQPDCCEHLADPSVRFHGWGRVPAGDVAAVKDAILTHGVVNAAVYITSSFRNYTGGIFTDAMTTCPDDEYTSTNHAVALVGWGYDETFGDYWILRNSWGSHWGEGGYMRIAVTAARAACAVAYLEYGDPGPPAADFVAVNCDGPHQSRIYEGEALTFRDISIGTPDAWQWEIMPESGVSFVAGTSPESMHIEVLFASHGIYSVSLTAANARGWDKLIKTDAVLVSGHNVATIPGDLDGDMAVTLADAVLALRICAGIHPPVTIFNAADIGGDGKIGMEEVIYIMENMAGMR